MRKIFLIVLVLIIGTGCSKDTSDSENEEFNFAVVSDSHLQDVKGEFKSDTFSGAKSDGNNYTIRPMYEQMTSTRLFNENYYAFYQVLNDLVDQGIKNVVFTGDISDDGQEMNIKKVADILNDYENKYDMNFYIVPGNHEPQSPERVDQGDDFLTSDGSAINVKSTLSEECQNNDSAVVCDNQMASVSQPEMADMLANFGYMPDDEDILWATPYSSYDLADYSYGTAKTESDMENRKYETCVDDECAQAYDMSYVVEPVDGYLFLCIDGDVYLPGEESKYELMGDNGLNYFLKYKKETLEFIKDVATYANENNKHVILFDHYPLADFYANDTENLKQVFTDNGLDFDRLANGDIVQKIAASGIDLMFSGHMHYNATGVYENADDYLVNVMTGSTAAYVPSYKVVSTSGDNKYEVETKVLKDVKDFDTLFPLYEAESEYESSLTTKEKEELGITDWNKDILNADNYYDFNKIFIETLVKTRHYPEWSDSLHQCFDNLNLYDLVVYSQINEKMTPVKFEKVKQDSNEIVSASNDFDQFLTKKNIDKASLEKIKGIDIVTTFYKFLSARELAYADYSPAEINAYSAAITYLTENEVNNANKNYTEQAWIILDAINKLANDVASNHFEIDLNNQQITDLSTNQTKITDEL